MPSSVSVVDLPAWVPEWVRRLPAKACPTHREAEGERCWRTFQANADVPGLPPGMKQFRCSKWSPAPEDFEGA